MEDQSVQNPVSEAVPAPVEVFQQKPRFPVMYLVLSVFILLFLASTTFLYYQNMQFKKMLVGYQTQVVSPTPSPTPDPTFSWQTYIDQNNSFSFKYPPIMNLKKTSNGISINELMNFQGPTDNFGDLPTEQFTQKMTIVVTNLATGTTLNSWFDQLYKNEVFYSDIKSSIKAENTGSTSSISFNIPGAAAYRTQRILIIRGNQGYTISIDGLGDLPEFDQILSTFKFTQ